MNNNNANNNSNNTGRKNEKIQYLQTNLPNYNNVNLIQSSSTNNDERNIPQYSGNFNNILYLNNNNYEYYKQQQILQQQQQQHFFFMQQQQQQQYMNNNYNRQQLGFIPLQYNYSYPNNLANLNPHYNNNNYSQYYQEMNFNNNNSNQIYQQIPIINTQQNLQIPQLNPNRQSNVPIPYQPNQLIQNNLINTKEQVSYSNFNQNINNIQLQTNNNNNDKGSVEYKYIEVDKSENLLKNINTVKNNEPIKYRPDFTDYENQKCFGFINWSNEEDNKLINLRETQKFNWNEVSKRLPGRTINACQCRLKRLQKTTNLQNPK